MKRKFKKVKEIKSEKNLDLKKAEKLTRKYIKDNPAFINGAIYINCPDISDLFIIENYKIRQCTNEEWVDYFYTYIAPRKQ